MQRGASYISHRLYFRHFFTFFGKNGFRSFLTNGRTDFRPNFANFRNFSGPYDGHTYSPPKKKTRKRTDGPGSIKKTTDGNGQHLGIPWPSLPLVFHTETCVTRAYVLLYVLSHFRSPKEPSRQVECSVLAKVTSVRSIVRLCNDLSL